MRLYVKKVLSVQNTDTGIDNFERNGFYSEFLMQISQINVFCIVSGNELLRLSLLSDFKGVHLVSSQATHIKDVFTSFFTLPFQRFIPS